MLANLGTIFLLGLISVSSYNDQADLYNYHATVKNDTVLKSAYIYLETDDDEYNFYLDLSFTCDFYYSQGSDDYIINNVKFETTIRRYYLNNNNPSGTYTTSITRAGGFHIYELDNNVYTFEWSFLHEDDTCHFKWYGNNNSLIGQNVVMCIPSSEEFITDSSISVNVDTSQFYTQLLDFGNYAKGYDSGYQVGYGNGYTEGYNDGTNYGYQTGYTDGYNEAVTQDETAVVIFSGIISVALIPINFFLACLNFEVFGINIGAFVSALLTVAIVVIITRMIVSGGNGGGDK